MERPEIMESMTHKPHDPGDPARIDYPLPDLVRLKIRMLAQGYTGHDDAAHLCRDPTLRMSAVPSAAPQAVFQDFLLDTTIRSPDGT